MDNFCSLLLHNMHEYSDIETIAAFLSVAEHGSFAGAGQALGRDPTVVSRRIRALETRLGVRLLRRSTRRVALTEAGAAYLARIRPLLNDWTVADEGAIYVVMPSSGGVPTKTRAFADFISERLRTPPWLDNLS